MVACRETFSDVPVDMEDPDRRFKTQCKLDAVSKGEPRQVC